MLLFTDYSWFADYYNKPTSHNNNNNNNDHDHEEDDDYYKMDQSDARTIQYESYKETVWKQHCLAIFYHYFPQVLIYFYYILNE